MEQIFWKLNIMSIGSDVLGNNHFRYRRVTPNIKKRMLNLANNRLSFTEIAKKLGLDPATVKYHLIEEEREKTLERARKSLRNNSRNEPAFFFTGVSRKEEEIQQKILEG